MQKTGVILLLLLCAYTNCFANTEELIKNIVFTDYKNNTFISNDYGITWASQSSNFTVPNHKEILFTDFRGNQKLSDDYGITWTQVEQENTIKQNSLIGIKLQPNPTGNNTTVTLDLETSGVLTVTLNDLLGSELFELHNEFENNGTFTKTFSLETLPTGVYYLRISHNGNVRMEKVIKN